MSPRLIIFDCDGTLVDSQHLICAAMNAAFEGEGLTLPEREAVLGIVGLSLPEAMWRLSEGSLDEGRVAKLVAGYRTAFLTLREDPAQEEPMYEGAAEAVRALAGQEGVVLGIATGKSQRGVARLLERTGLRDCFATIQTADDAPSKPHPGMIMRAMDATRALPADTLMIGDTTFDMEMARSAKVRGLGVAWGYHPPERLRASGAHHVASDFPDLLQVIGRLAEEREAAE